MLQFSSWVDERLPDVLWLAIIRSTLGQEAALAVFREFIDNFEYTGQAATPIPTHTFLSTLSDLEFARYMRPVISNTELCRALGALLKFDNIPDRQHWVRHALVNGDSFNVLAEAVFQCLDHQSQASTDIRWFSVMCMMRNGKIVFPNDAKFRDRAQEYYEYPNRGDQRSVRPLIRSMEIAFRREPGETASQWCAAFWKECWRTTICIPGERSIANSKEAIEQHDARGFINRVEEIYGALDLHFRSSRDNTSLDARHDSVFGFAFYALYLAFESIATGAYQRAIGQTIVRSIAEIALTLGYLRKIDDPALWAQYRNYGMGQVKLSFLKMLEKEDVPGFVDMDFFERLINEDFWHEHLEINLGHWAGRDLRKLADECGMKDIYDKYYSTTSPFVHGTWSAVRMVSFETCLNPLHRFHRIPSAPNLTFPSSATDLKKLVNIVLELLASTYPEFKLRIRDEDFHKKGKTEE